MTARICNLSIDTGINVGYALWDCRRWTKLVPPIAHGSSNAPRVGDWQKRVIQSLRSFEMMLAHEPYIMRLRDVFIEIPDFVAGDTIKLVFTVGWIARWAEVSRRARVHLIGVNEWKGQLKKKQTDARITQLLGARFLKQCVNDHERDAVGLGLHCKGFEFG
jgi:hypothetical protein